MAFLFGGAENISPRNILLHNSTRFSCSLQNLCTCGLFKHVLSSLVVTNLFYLDNASVLTHGADIPSTVY